MMIAGAANAAAVHAAFEYAAIALGVALYRRERRRTGAAALTSNSVFPVIVGLLAGAAIGNKAVYFIDRPDIWRTFIDGGGGWPGQSIVGGLIGGLIGVEAAKELTRQRQSTGDAMVWPIAWGIALGRVGCFLAGLNDDTYGLPTSRPWGVDFGDGVLRHPTQIYEMIFVIAYAWVLDTRRDSLSRVPGLRFKLFLAGYLLWRLAVEALKPVFVPYPGGLSGIQWVCIASLIAYAPFVARAALKEH
jgi:phosphatidylglycerol:prolipoprotein diacylglycerol transferase